MKLSFIEFVRSAIQHRDEKFRKRFSIFLVCLVISIIIWFTVKMSNEYDTVIQMPVTFVNIPKNKVLTFASDSTLQVEVIEKGSRLFQMLYLQKVEPVSISLKYTSFTPENGSFSGMITPYLLINEIEREQNLLGKIVSVSPDTVYLTLEPELEKKVPVTATFDLEFEKQYMRYGKAVFEPDSVMIRGPERFIRQIDTASLGHITLSGLKEHVIISREFHADSSMRSVSYQPGTIKVGIGVEKYTEAEAEVPVSVINTDERIKTFPERIKVTYHVALKDYKEIEPGMIRAIADFSSAQASRDHKIRVRIEHAPELIQIRKIEPEKVEYIIVR